MPIIHQYSHGVSLVTDIMISKTVLLTVLFIIIKISSINSCRISEFYCDNGECVGLDKFCDGNKDCQDGSDETRFCSRCNRTYYGDRQKTYQIDISRGSLGRLPFVCALTFMAGGGDLGDIVELSFERFRVGRLLPSRCAEGFQQPSGCADGYMQPSSCADGFLQLLERNAQPTSAGRWCGPAVNIPVYYSETNNVTLLLTVLSAADFQFAVKFRYLARAEAVTRYGPGHAQYHRGEWIPSSVCDRSFQDCDSQTCKLHSPNFPGVYPRNVTCLYHVTQRTIPRGKHAFVVLQQRHEDRVSVWVSGEARAAYRREEKLQFGKACAHDYLRVYDGADSSAAVLATFCHGGALPPIVSSGPEMLVEFRASSADLLELHTFELDIEVIFLPESDVGLKASNGYRCEWTVDAEERRTGVIHSLRHLAPPNTSCSYAFRGRPDDLVWLYFVKYFVDNRVESADRTQPSVQGALYDGGPSTANITRLAAFDDDTPVRLCVHARAFPNFIPLRPCRYPDESYLSSGPDLLLRYTFSPLFNLHYLRMEARYEFVDTYQEGEPAIKMADKIADGACDRIFRSKRRPEGTFASPKNVFLFGRGGRRALRCSYTFIGRETETIRLIFHKVRLGNRKCDTLHDLHTRRYVCHPQGPDHGSSIHREEAELRVSQTLQGGVEMPMACLCRLDEHLTLDLMANRATVIFSVTGMTSLEDFDSFYFDAKYEFLGGVHCNAGHVLDGGGGGEIALVAGEADIGDGPARVRCPWLLPAAADHFVHLRIPGVTLSELCETNNRILVFAADELEPVAVVCPAVRGHETPAGGPAAAGEVEVYTRSWNKTVMPGRRHSNTLVVEFHAVEPGRFYFRWSRAAKSRVNKLLGRRSRSEECAAKCSEPASCNGVLFWCEQQAQCGDACTPGPRFPWLYVGIGIGCGVLVTMILVASLLHRRRETKAKKGKPVPTDEYPMDGKEVDC